MIPYEELVWGDKFKALCAQLPGVHYIDTGKPARPPRADVIRMVSHNGDEPITAQTLAEYPNLRVWLGQNICCDDPRAHPLPIGFENDYISGQPWRKEYLLELSGEMRPAKKLCYFNCSPTHPARRAAFDYFSQQQWCKVRNERLLHTDFYDELLDHCFIVSPRGNGLDTHRHWETLLLRRYPIIQRDWSMERLFDGLPVVFIDDWREVTPALLFDKLAEFGQLKFNLEKMTFSYWARYICRELSCV